MAGPATFAIVHRDNTRPSLDALKRVFAAFTNLTESDAVRVAGNPTGFLLRQLRRDAAQALQRDLHAEGISSALVDEDEIPKLPAAKALHRLDLTPEALVAYDVIGRTRSVEWAEIRLIAAGAIHQVPGAAPQLVMEILLTDGRTRYQIQPEGFPFKYLIDRPDLTLPQKFVWLVREICSRTPGAVLNEGARAYAEGRAPAAEYKHPQALADEMTWLLWQAGNPAKS